VIEDDFVPESRPGVSELDETPHAAKHTDVGEEDGVAHGGARYQKRRPRVSFETFLVSGRNPVIGNETRDFRVLA
jgi:hypothetical protein